MGPQTAHLLGAAATLYGLGGALSVLLQARRMHVRGTSGDVLVRFFAGWSGRAVGGLGRRPSQTSGNPLGAKFGEPLLHAFG